MVATPVNLVRVVLELGLRRVLPLIAEALGEAKGVSNIPITADEVDVLEEMLPDTISGFHRKRIMYQVRVRLALLDGKDRKPEQNRKYDCLLEVDELRTYKNMFLMLRKEGYPIDAITVKDLRQVGVARQHRSVVLDTISSGNLVKQGVTCEVLSVISGLSFAELYTGFFGSMNPTTVSLETFEVFSKSLIEQKDNFAHHPFHVTRIIHAVAVDLGLRTPQPPIDTLGLLRACNLSEKYGYQTIFQAHGLAAPTKVSILPYMTVDDFGSLGVRRLHAKKLVDTIKKISSSDDNSVETMSSSPSQASGSTDGPMSVSSRTVTTAGAQMRPRSRRGLPEDQPETMLGPLRPPGRQISSADDGAPPVPPVFRSSRSSHASDDLTNSRSDEQQLSGLTGGQYEKKQLGGAAPTYATKAPPIVDAPVSAGQKVWPGIVASSGAVQDHVHAAPADPSDPVSVTFGGFDMTVKGAEEEQTKSERNLLQVDTMDSETGIALLCNQFEAERLALVNKDCERPSALDTGRVQQILQLTRDELKRRNQLESRIERALGTVQEYVPKDEKAPSKAEVSRIVRHLRELKRKLVPCDFSRLIELVEQGAQSARKIKDQDIVLLLGGTGTGKTTTVLFLGGVSHRIAKHHGSEFLQPCSAIPEPLRPFVTSASHRSTTKCINAIELPPIDGGRNNPPVILCDTPGFHDTEGPEMDIANGFVIVRAIQECHSVKPVLLLSRLSLGEKAITPLQDMTKLLGSLIDNFEEHVDALSFVATRGFKDDTAEDVMEFFLQVADDAEVDGQLTSQLKALIDAVANKMGDEGLIIKASDAPDALSPRDVLSRLLGSGVRIESPKDAFRTFVAPKSMSAVREQFSIHESTVKAVLRSPTTLEGLKLVERKLNEMFHVQNLLADLHDVRNMYEEAVMAVQDVRREKLRTLQAQLGKINGMATARGPGDEFQNDALETLSEVSEALPFLTTLDMKLHMKSQDEDIAFLALKTLKGSLVSLAKPKEEGTIQDMFRETNVSLKKLYLMKQVLLENEAVYGCQARFILDSETSEMLINAGNTVVNQLEDKVGRVVAAFHEAEISTPNSSSANVMLEALETLKAAGSAMVDLRLPDQYSNRMQSTYSSLQTKLTQHIYKVIEQARHECAMVLDPGLPARYQNFPEEIAIENLGEALSYVKRCCEPHAAASHIDRESLIAAMEEAKVFLVNAFGAFSEFLRHELDKDLAAAPSRNLEQTRYLATRKQQADSLYVSISPYIQPCVFSSAEIVDQYLVKQQACFYEGLTGLKNGRIRLPSRSSLERMNASLLQFKYVSLSFGERSATEYLEAWEALMDYVGAVSDSICDCLSQQEDNYSLDGLNMILGEQSQLRWLVPLVENLAHVEEVQEDHSRTGVEKWKEVLRRLDNIVTLHTYELKDTLANTLALAVRERRAHCGGEMLKALVSHLRLIELMASPYRSNDSACALTACVVDGMRWWDSMNTDELQRLDESLQGSLSVIDSNIRELDGDEEKLAAVAEAALGVLNVVAGLDGWVGALEANETLAAGPSTSREGSNDLSSGQGTKQCVVGDGTDQCRWLLETLGFNLSSPTISLGEVHAAFWVVLRQNSLSTSDLDLLQTEFFGQMTESAECYSFVIWSFHELSLLPAKARKNGACEVLRGVAEFLRGCLPTDEDLLLQGTKLRYLERLLGKLLILDGIREDTGQNEGGFTQLTVDVETKLKLLAMETQSAKNRLILLLESHNYHDFVDHFRENGDAVRPFCSEFDDIMALKKGEAEATIRCAFEGMSEVSSVSLLARELSSGLKSLVDMRKYVLEMWTAEWETTELKGLDVTVDDTVTKLEASFQSRLSIVSREEMLVSHRFAAVEKAIQDCQHAIDALVSAVPNAVATIESLKLHLAKKEEERAFVVDELSRRYDAALTVELVKEPSLREIVFNLEKCGVDGSPLMADCLYSDSVERLKTGFQTALSHALERMCEQGTLIDGNNTKLLLFLEEYIKDLVPDDLEAVSKAMVEQTAEHIKELHAEEHKKQMAELQRNRKNEQYEESLVRELRPIVVKFEHELKNGEHWSAENHSKYIHKLILDGVDRYERFLAEGKIEFVLRKLPVAYNEWCWYDAFAAGVPRAYFSSRRAWDTTSWKRNTDNFLGHLLIPSVHSRLSEINDARRGKDEHTFVRLVVEHLPFMLACLSEELGCDDRIERTLLDQGHFPVQLHKRPEWKNHYDPSFTLRMLASGILVEALLVAIRQAQSKEALENEDWDAVIVSMRTFDDARHLVSEMSKGRTDLSREITEHLDEAVRLFEKEESTPRNFVSTALHAEKEEICCPWEGNPQLETPVKDDKSALFMDLNTKFHKLSNSVARLRADLPECAGLVDTCKLTLKHNLESLRQSLKGIVATFPPTTDETYDALTRKMEVAVTFKESFDEIDLQNEARALYDEIETNLKEKLARSKDNSFRMFKQQLLDDTVPTADAVSQFLPMLLSQQKIANRLPNVRKKAKKLTEDALKEIQQIEGRGPYMIYAIETELKNCGDPVGMTIVSTQSAFGGSTIFDRNSKTSKFTVDDVLAQMEQGNQGFDDITRLSEKEKGNLKSQYDAFEKDFIDLIEADMEDLVKMTEEDVSQELPKRQQSYVERARDCSNPTCRSVRTVLCNIFGYWCLDFCRESLSNYKGQTIGQEDQGCTTMFEALSKSLRKPHAAQVVSLFRLFGMERHNANPSGFFGNQKEEATTTIRLSNHMAEILTGQGKSITLAAAATTLALLGYLVDCACYSEYLTVRDEEQFRTMFEDFGVEDRVFYGTFNNLCEKLLNASGNLRSVAREYLLSGSFAGSVRNTSRLKRALLIDEADVFFKEDFHGSVYRPDAIVKPAGFFDLVQHAWNLRQNRKRCDVGILKMSQHYGTVADSLGVRIDIFDELLETLVSDLKTFESHTYICDGGRIGYMEADGSVSYRARVRFQTMFAYFKEFENGGVSQAARDNSVGLVFNCGAFSFAEIPLKYDVVIGVTGTLRTLTSPEKRLLTDKYGIKKSTFVPSVYGSRQLQFAGDNCRDVIICRNSQDWLLAIKQEIETRLGGKKMRSVLVFFENSEILDKFREYAKEYRNSWLVMKETTQDSDKPTIIGKATTKGQVTLLTREFGRGTDFYCCDLDVIKRGGVHVIQAFVSDQVSEETQIKGRTARQDQKGSFSMVLHSVQLERLGLFENDVTEMINQSKLYSRICEKREELCSQVHDMRVEFEDEIREDHQRSIEFTKAIEARDVRRIHGFIKERNEGVRLGGDSRSRTIVALDATGSMTSLLEGAKLAISKMFTRAYQVFEEETGKSASLQMQFCAYRNYDSEADALLTSSWETSPEQLISFVSPIRASGGWNNEAIELALNHALNEHRIEPIGQVIVVGDAPPNTRDETIEKRAAGFTPFPEVFFDDVQRELVDENVPIHAFYIQTWATKEDFKKVAAGPESRFEEIDVSDSQAVETITQVVTERMLNSYAGGGELGQRLISRYRQKFCKGYS